VKKQILFPHTAQLIKLKTAFKAAFTEQKNSASYPLRFLVVFNKIFTM
jgi:hypothetical protein